MSTREAATRASHSSYCLVIDSLAAALKIAWSSGVSLSHDAFDITNLSVALRQLRNLVLSTAPGA